MLRPWGPSALHPLGFIAHHAGLSRERVITRDPRKRLLEILDGLDVGTLGGEDRNTLARIDQERPWLLTARQIAFLERLHSVTEIAPK